MTSELWSGIKIPVVGVSGDFNVGKTIFLCDIALPDTPFIYYDMEKSGASYEHLYPNMTRIDLPGMMAEKYPRGYTEAELFSFWHDHLKSLEPGKYSVIAVDTLDALELGLEQLITANYKKYGVDNKDDLLKYGKLWSILKSEWRRILLGEAASKCETFAFATHMKTVWRNKQPTKDKIPAGKEVLMQIASLYLVLNREPNTDVPWAVSLKRRMLIRSPATGAKMPLIPDRLPQATPDAIREYIASPMLQRTQDEMLEPDLPSEQDRIELELALAEAKRLQAEAEAKAATEQRLGTEAKERARSKLMGGVTEALALPSDVFALLERAEKLSLDNQLRDAILEKTGDRKFTSAVAAKVTRSLLSEFSEKLDAYERAQNG